MPCAGPPPEAQTPQESSRLGGPGCPQSPAELLQSLPWLLLLEGCFERSFAPVPDLVFFFQDFYVHGNKLSDGDACLSLVFSCLESLQDSKGASAVAEKQHKILTELEQEQVMLQQEEPGFLLCVVERCNTGRWLELLEQNFLLSLKRKGH